MPRNFIPRWGGWGYDILVNGKVIEGVFGDSRTAQRRAEQIEKILREKGFEVL